MGSSESNLLGWQQHIAQQQPPPLPQCFCATARLATRSAAEQQAPPPSADMSLNPQGETGPSNLLREVMVQPCELAEAQRSSHSPCRLRDSGSSWCFLNTEQQPPRPPCFMILANPGSAQGAQAEEQRPAPPRLMTPAARVALPGSAG